MFLEENCVRLDQGSILNTHLLMYKWPCFGTNQKFNPPYLISENNKKLEDFHQADRQNKGKIIGPPNGNSFFIICSDNLFWILILNTYLTLFKQQNTNFDPFYMKGFLVGTKSGKIKNLLVKGFLGNELIPTCSSLNHTHYTVTDFIPLNI